MKRLVFLALAALPALAHHSVNAEFNTQAPVKLTGVVTKIEWMNPHAWFYVDVKDDKGTVEHWQFETGAPIELVRKGWKKTDLKIGDEVTVNGFRAKDGTNTANAREVQLPGGKKVFTGSASDGLPQDGQ